MFPKSIPGQVYENYLLLSICKTNVKSNDLGIVIILMDANLEP
jgi:hypothetical protein